MQRIWIYLFLLLSLSSNAQNLVPNWSFEDTVSCPFGTNQIIKADGWNSFRQTPDYFNSCNLTIVSVPTNLYDYQIPHTGSAYAGFASYVSTNSIFREWIGIQLSQPLIIGQKYFASFYVSRAVNNNSGYKINIATNKLGIRFSTLVYPNNNLLPLNGFAHVYTDSIIADTLNWTKITGSFIADSAYSYLIIGNFASDSLMSKVSYDTSAITSYYFLDDITVSTDSTLNSISSMQSYNTFVYPNPFQDFIIIESSNLNSIIIYDSTWRKCLENKKVQDLTKIFLFNLEPGIYYIKLIYNQKSIIKKVLKI